MIPTQPSKWQQRFMEMARLAASWSKDPSHGVGAVIAAPNNRVVSVGFNGLPQGYDDDALLTMEREQKWMAVIHAEENAILFAQRNLQGHNLFVYPLHPCEHCASLIHQVGITRVYVPNYVYPNGVRGEHEAKARALLGDKLMVLEFK